MNPIAERMYGRKTAGPDTRLRTGVGVIIRDERGRILLEKRSDNGIWAIPGGGIEPGESVEEAALREIKEETGLTVKITKLIGIYSEPSERIVTYPDNGDVCHLVDVIVEATIVSGTLTRSSESEDLQFFDPHQLPSEIAPPGRAPLEDVLSGRYGQIR